MGNASSSEQIANVKEGTTLTMFYFNGILHVKANGQCERKLTISIRNNFNSCFFNTAYTCNNLYFVQRKRLITLLKQYGCTRKIRKKGIFLRTPFNQTKIQIKTIFHDRNSKNVDLYTDLDIQLVVKKKRKLYIKEHEIIHALTASFEQKSRSLSTKHIVYDKGVDWILPMSICYVYPVSRSLEETFTSLIKGVSAENMYYDDEIMSNYLQRLATFQHFIYDNVPSSVRLAEAGWFFTGKHKETKCFVCKILYSLWTREDDPLEIHRELQPRCEFVMETELHSKKAATKGYVSCGGEEGVNDTWNSSKKHSHNPAQNVESKTKIQSKNAASNGYVSCGEDSMNGTRRSSQTHAQNSVQYAENSSTEPTGHQYTELSKHSGMNNSVEALSNPQFEVAGENVHGETEMPKLKENGNFRPQMIMTQDQHHNSNYQRMNGGYYNFQDEGLSNHFTNLSIGNGTGLSLLSIDEVPSTLHVQSHMNGQHQQHFPAHDRMFQQGYTQQNHPVNGIRNMQREFPEMKYPSFQALPVRMSTFASWPVHTKLSPRTMALAGFFYKGYSDVVACFWCGISIVDWEEGDDPYIEHVRWQPLCPFMIQTKGEAFISLVQKNSPEANERRAIEANNVGEKQSPPVTPAVVNTQYDILTSMGFSENEIKTAIGRLLLTTGNKDPGLEAILDNLVEASRASELNQTRLASQSLARDDQPSDFSNQAIYRENESRMPIGNTGEGHKDQFGESKNDERLLCKICFDKQVGVTFAPCGHLTSCVECSQNLLNCPVCRMRIQQKIKCFIT